MSSLPMVMIVPSAKAKVDSSYESYPLIHNHCLFMVSPHYWKRCVIWMSNHAYQRMLQHPSFGVHTVDTQNSGNFLVQQDTDSYSRLLD